jgi:hypothetical protein
VVQTRYLPLFSDRPHAALVALLSLVPWMWSVVITDLSRFLFESDNVHAMEATFDALKAHITDPAILETLRFIGSDEEDDIYLSVAQLCSLVVPQLETEDLLLLARFYTSCLLYGDKTMISPLYSVVTGLLSYSMDSQKVAVALGAFVASVRRDKNEARRSYRDIFLAAYDRTGVHATKAPDIVPSVWSQIMLFERIVAVKIPHLYEVGQADVATMSLQDLNSFPPMIPFEQCLRGSDKFQLLTDLLTQYRFEPFVSWWEFTAKLMASVVDTEELEGLRHAMKLGDLRLRSSFEEILENIEVRQEVVPQEYAPAAIEEEEENHEEVGGDPYAFVFVQSRLFLPSSNSVYAIGEDLNEGESFEQNV